MYCRRPGSKAGKDGGKLKTGGMRRREKPQMGGMRCREAGLERWRKRKTGKMCRREAEPGKPGEAGGGPGGAENVREKLII